jgi:hypothetical protein
VCHRQNVAGIGGHLTVDLCGVTAMDTEAQEVLQELFQRGATLTCSDVLNRYLVELMSHAKRRTQGACRPCHSGEVPVASANGRR